MAKECPLDIIDRTLTAATTVHRHLCPALLESLYESALVYELRQAGIAVRRQAPLPVIYRGVDLGIGFRADLLVAYFAAAGVSTTRRHTRWIYFELQSPAAEGRNPARFSV